MSSSLIIYVEYLAVDKNSNLNFEYVCTIDHFACCKMRDNRIYEDLYSDSIYPLSSEIHKAEYKNYYIANDGLNFIENKIRELEKDIQKRSMFFNIVKDYESLQSDLECNEDDEATVEELKELKAVIKYELHKVKVYSSNNIIRLIFSIE